jgi:uncharacterized protein YbgA (DUF1722 family)
MDIKHYRDIKRAIKVGKYEEYLDTQDMKELTKLIDDYREFNNHLLAYMTMGFSTKFKNFYDVKAAAIALQERIK